MRGQSIDLGLESVARASKTAYQQQWLAVTVKLIVCVESASLNCRQLNIAPFVEWNAGRDDFSNFEFTVKHHIFDLVSHLERGRPRGL